MIEFQNVSKSFSGQIVLADVSFGINVGDRIGVVGPNGAGKSTVFNLIAGDISPDRGKVLIARNCSLGYIHQEINPLSLARPLLDYVEHAASALHQLHERMEELDDHLQDESNSRKKQALRELSELQTKFEHLGGYDIRHRAEAALCGLGFSMDAMDQTVGSLSGGWQMRAELARVLVADPDVLLLDEPSNYLDIPAIEWLRKFLQDFPGTLAMISHDRYLLNSLTTITLEVANGRIDRYAGNYTFYARERALRTEQRLAQKKNMDRKRRQIERFVERFKAKSPFAARAQSRVKMLARMEEIEVPEDAVSPGTIRLREPPRSGTEVVRLEDAGLTYDKTRWVLRHVDLRVERGDRMALVGLNGLGKSTLLRMLAGQLPLSEGRRAPGHNVVAGYQSQEFAETMDPDLTVYETVKSIAPEVPDKEIRSLLGGFGFSGDAIEKKVAILSGGEKIRLAFARLMNQPVNFLVLDEPTTHLDIAAREALEKALKAYAGTICLVSHDIDFVRHIATSIIAMTPPGITRYWGGYDYYREKLLEQQEAVDRSGAADRNGKPDRKADRRERARRIQERSRLRRPLKEAMTRAEVAIERLEKERAELVAALEAAALTRNYADINQRLTAIQDEISRATTQWEEAAAKLERLERERSEAEQES